MYVAFVQ